MVIFDRISMTKNITMIDNSNLKMYYSKHSIPINIIVIDENTYLITNSISISTKLLPIIPNLNEVKDDISNIMTKNIIDQIINTNFINLNSKTIDIEINKVLNWIIYHKISKINFIIKNDDKPTTITKKITTIITKNIITLIKINLIEKDTISEINNLIN